jgi:hypothetical protein
MCQLDHPKGLLSVDIIQPSLIRREKLFEGNLGFSETVGAGTEGNYGIG